jgi:hypothetical protein
LLVTIKLCCSALALSETHLAKASWRKKIAHRDHLSESDTFIVGNLSINIAFLPKLASDFVLEKDRKVSVLRICRQLFYNKTSPAARPIYVSKYAGSCYQIVWFEILKMQKLSQ